MAYFSDALTKQNGTALTRSHTLLSHFFRALAALLPGFTSWPDALRLRDAPEGVLVVLPEDTATEVDGFGGAVADGTGLGSDIFDNVEGYSFAQIDRMYAARVDEDVLYPEVNQLRLKRENRMKTKKKKWSHY